MGIWDKIKGSIEKSVGKETDKIEKGRVGKADKYLSDKFAYKDGEGPSASKKGAAERAGKDREAAQGKHEAVRASATEAERRRIEGLPELTPDAMEGAADIKGAWEEYNSWLTDAEARKTSKLATARAQMASSGMSTETPAWTNTLSDIEAEYETEVGEIKGGATYGYLQDQYKIATSMGPSRDFRAASGSVGMEEWYGQAWGGNSGMAQNTFDNFGAQASIYNTPLGA